MKNERKAFSGTIPLSESVGFNIDDSEPNTIDFFSGMTAHEFAHQWFCSECNVTWDREGIQLGLSALSSLLSGDEGTE